ncbi:GTP-binding protein At3g49725, chloroplastic [Rosa chinensis]|nr:GTP-binding protein At3g49725, chloroplastic [Rosa chinensis]
MLRTISISRTPLRSLFQNRAHHCSIPNQTALPPSASSSLISYSLYSTSAKQEKEDRNEVVSLFNRDPAAPPRLFVVQPRLRPDSILHAKLNEALSLANSLEEQRNGCFENNLCDKETPPHVVVQNPIVRHQTRADTYFGKGTLEAVKCYLNAAEEKDQVDAVFVNTTLSGIQQRNLERVLGKPVLDRVGLIIEIFNAHACTKEGKLQAELAALMYKKTRLIRTRGPSGRLGFGMGGEAEVVSARGRGNAGPGFISGAGETELQLQRRRILERRSSLLQQIKDVRRTRAVQRASRKRHGSSGQGLATVAVVGYTNAGKSTLVSALSHSDLYSDSRLFATVDPRLRSVLLPSGRKVLVSDTVGFISDLPVQLVEAFHATLEEVVEADLLVHVLDCTAPNLEEHRSTVLHVLEQIGVSKEKLENMIEVWNKIDSEGEDMGMDVNESLDDGEDGEVSSLSGEDDDVESELSTGAANCRADDPLSELSAENPEAMDDQELDSEDNQDHWGEEGGFSMGPKTLNDRQSEYPKDWAVEKQLQSRAPSGPHVRTSAITGVGLQELLELIDEKLKVPNVLEKGVFDRKWRPSRTEEAGLAVEQ